MPREGFPRALLQAAQSERLGYFRAYTIAHPRLKAVSDALWRAIQEPAGRALILVIGPTGVGKTTLRLRMEQALRHRRPAAVLIDEAQHVTKMASGRRLADQLDYLKSLASVTGCVHVLIGTYELLPCRNLSAQLSRRSIDLHFQRYQVDNPDDVIAFQRVI